MRTKDQGTLDKILKFVNKYYQENRVAPTISEVAAGVGVARSTTHRYIQEALAIEICLITAEVFFLRLRVPK